MIRTRDPQIASIPFSQLSYAESYKINSLRRNGKPPLFDVLPFEINIENYFLLIGIICTLFGKFPRSSVG